MLAICSRHDLLASAPDFCWPHTCAGDRRPAVDEEGLVHWPVLFFYPEASMQHDVVDDVCEEDMLR